jgi:hypothetical protein
MHCWHMMLVPGGNVVADRRFSCPYCGETLFSGARGAQGSLQCPRCGQWVSAAGATGLIDADSLESLPTAVPIAQELPEAIRVQPAGGVDRYHTHAPDEEIPEVIPVRRPDFSPLGRTVLVRHSLLRAIPMACMGLVFGIACLIAVPFLIPNCWGWGLLALGLLFVLVGIGECRRIFHREPVLIIDPRGFYDIRAKEGEQFIPWDSIVDASSFRLVVQLTAWMDDLTILYLTGDNDMVKKKIDVVGLTMRGKQIADLIRQNLRAMGR